jgi:hypothetical protein
MVKIVNEVNKLFKKTKDCLRLADNLEMAIDCEFGEVALDCDTYLTKGTMFVRSSSSGNAIMNVYFSEGRIDLYAPEYRKQALKIAKAYEKLKGGKEITLIITAR